MENDGFAYFNPRTPCEVRRPGNHTRECTQQFQSTHPLRGATLYIVFYTEPQHRQRADYSKKMNFSP